MIPNPSPQPHSHSPVATATTADAVFDALVAAIVRAEHPPGTRLPAERELARRLGASRPTLREALKRLVAWNLVSARRGSGIVVRDPEEWSIEVLPAFLRHGLERVDGEPVDLVRLVSDMLVLRRCLMVEIVKLVAERLPPSGTASARAALDRAWAERGDAERFVQADLGILRALVGAAGFLPAVWLLNRLATVYLDLTRSLAGAIDVPLGYREAHESVLDALDRGDATRAVLDLDTYLQAHDRALLERLGLSMESPA